MYTEKIDKITLSNHIGISFSIFNNNIYLDIYSNINEIGLAKGDQLILLFESGEKIDLKFQQKRSSGYIKSNSYLINDSHLEMLIKQKLDKWKLISIRRNVYVVGDNSIFYELCQIDSKRTAQEIIQYLALTIKEKNDYTQNYI